MSDDDQIYEPIWNCPPRDFDTDEFKPNPPQRNGSLRTDLSVSEDERTGYLFEGESVDNLDIFEFKAPNPSLTIKNEIISRPNKLTSMPFPKKPCFSELDDTDKLEIHGPIIHIVQKITTNKKSRYAVLLSNRLILYEKPEHKVSKVQIPIASMTGISWVDNTNSNNKNDCNKFKLDTHVRSYKFQCSNHENAGQWINNLGKLIYDKQHAVETAQTYILKASVSLESVKGKRIFAIEPKFTVAYYESEEDFKYGIAMHRIQLRSSGLKRDRVDNNSFTLITSYREYKLTFESSLVCTEWYDKLSVIIQNAISSTLCSKDARSGEEIYVEVCRNESNRFCAECQSPDIQWASINLLVTLCSNCSGLHRGLGPNISRVQGIFTDETRWEDTDLITLFQVIGNDTANRFWLASYTEETSDVDHKFVSDKYVKKKYMEKRENIFDKYKDARLLNDELFQCVQSDDIVRTMKLFHIGADMNYTDPSSKLNVLACAEKYEQRLQKTFLNNQCKIPVKDWRDELMDAYDCLRNNDSAFQKRSLLCSINQEPVEEKLILIRNDRIDILEKDALHREICSIHYWNICLVREQHQQPDGASLILAVRDTEYTYRNQNGANAVNIIEFYGNDDDQCNDLGDFKNVMGQNMYPRFSLASSYDCLAWVILSTISEDWRPYLLFINYNSFADFYDPYDTTRCQLSLDLRKVQKIDELKDNNYENMCSFKMYNLASICLMSSVIYHVRGDTRQSYDEILRALRQSWSARDGTSLHNQFLTQNDVPLPIYKMIRYLQIHGTQIEGLFRRVGSVKEAEKIYNELISNPNSYMLANCDAHDVASALKLFFRKLTDPLLTNRLYENWIYAVQIENSHEKLQYFKQVVQALPVINYQTLRLLIFLLVNVDKNTEVTQMNPDNLGTSFNTCLLVGATTSDAFVPQNLLVLPYLIRNYQHLFDVTHEELEKEKMFVRKINDLSPIETTLLRQIHIHPQLENLLRTDMTFERETNSKKTAGLLSKQLRIEQSMTSMAVLKKIFKDDVNFDEISIFEDRKIDELHMHRLIYPQQNLIEVIQTSESSDSKTSFGKKWICKFNDHSLQTQSKDSSFQCWVSLSISNRNKVYLELSETSQINIWKNDQMTEILTNIPIRAIYLYRSRETDKFIIAFEDRKNPTNVSFFSLFSFKSRPSFNIISFYNKSDYVTFLHCYDQLKLFELTTKTRPTNVSKC